MGGKMNKIRDNHAKIERRGSLDIIAEILDAAASGAVKTRIMNRAHLNFEQFNMYAKWLLNAKLLRVNEFSGKTLYRTTEKGKFLLQKFSEIKSIVKNPGNERNVEPKIIRRGNLFYLMKH